MAPVLPRLGSVVGSSYRLVSRLGEGASGVVFLAARGSDERFAIKILSLDRGNERGLSRFLREARVASNLKSPHILPVVESGIDGPTGLCFLAMPLVHGEDVSQLVKRVGALPPRTAVRIALEAAEGLGAAHEAGVIHRDVKPSNLMLELSGEHVTTLVADFGIAKEAAAVDALTATGAAMGSPLYMAPEQFRDAKAVDARADVWGLAMTLYEALSGKPALADATSMAEIVLKVTVADFPDLQDVAPWVPPELAAIVHGALRPELADRCPSVSALGAALRGCIPDDRPLTRADLRALTDAERAERPARQARPLSWTLDVQPVLSGTLPERDPLLGETFGGVHTLVRKLGEGGMGTVYEAVTPSGERTAVKVVRGDGGDRDTLRRFLREARATRAVASEHVVRVLDTDEATPQGAPFLAMELLVGLDLDTLIKRAGALEPSAAARVFVQAAKGLAAAHDAGIVHRDVKPANLFLHELPSGEIVTKVCDFGVAKSVVAAGGDATTLDLTRTGGMLGSPMYMSPEQARNAKQVDARTDVWSLCLSLYEALTGQKPWASCTTMGELILAICTTEVAPLQSLAPWVSPELATVVHRGLQRNAGERWASMTELASALEPLAARGPATRTSLCALTIEARASVAPRAASAPATPSEPAALSSSLVQSALSTAPSHASRRRGAATTAGAVLLAAAIAALAWSQARGPAHDASAAASAPLAPPAAPARRAASVRITPPDARVSVGGTPRALGAGGVLALEGEIGEGFDVVAESAGGRASARVFVTREGTADPSELVVPSAAPSPPSASAAAPASAASPGGKSANRPPPGRPAPVPASAPPTPPRPPAGPRLHDDL